MSTSVQTSKPRPAPGTSPARRRRRTWIRVLIGLVVVAALACEGLAVFVGWSLTHPARKVVDDSPANHGMTYEDITFASRADGLHLKGWYIPAGGKAADKTVIIAHGFRANRLENGPKALNVAKMLTDGGYNVVMFDFRGSGESEGNEVTVGYRERHDLAGAVDFARSRGARKVALLGYSMGAATALLTGSELPEVDAVIADAPFRGLGPMVLENAKAFTKLPDFPFTYLIYVSMPPIVGASFDQVSPIDEMDGLAKKPLLLIHGLDDRLILKNHSEELYKAYQAHGGTQGELWLVPGAGHVASFKAAPAEYTRRVLGFLGKYLQ